MGKEHEKGIQADDKVAVIINSGIISIIPTAHGMVDGLVMRIGIAYAGKQGYIMPCAGVQGGEHHLGIVVILKYIAGEAVFVDMGIDIPKPHAKQKLNIKSPQKVFVA
jgi:hypothetical protein